MTEIKNKKELTAVLSERGDKVTVLKFSASWCYPCRQLGEVIETIEPDYPDVKFLDVDVDEADEEFVTENSITNIPVLKYFKGGVELLRTVGFLPKQELIKKIESLTK